MLQEPTILLINDQVHLRDFIKYILMDKYRIASAGGLKEAFYYMAVSPVHLVLLDAKVARLDGISILKEIKERYPDIEVIMLTAYASIETIRQAFKLGAFGFLMKPFDIDKFITTVDEALAFRH